MKLIVGEERNSLAHMHANLITSHTTTAPLAEISFVVILRGIGQIYMNLKDSRAGKVKKNKEIKRNFKFQILKFRAIFRLWAPRHHWSQTPCNPWNLHEYIVVALARNYIFKK